MPDMGGMGGMPGMGGMGGMPGMGGMGGGAGGMDFASMMGGGAGGAGGMASTHEPLSRVRTLTWRRQDFAKMMEQMKAAGIGGGEEGLGGAEGGEDSSDDEGVSLSP